MAWLKKLLIILSSVTVIFIVFMFSFYNLTPVSVDLLIFSAPPLPLALWVVGGFVAGGVLGLSLSYLATLRYQLRAGRLQRNLDKLKEQDAATAGGDLAAKRG